MLHNALAVKAAQLQQAVVNQPCSHAVADQSHRPAGQHGRSPPFPVEHAAMRFQITDFYPVILTLLSAGQYLQVRLCYEARFALLFSRQRPALAHLARKAQRNLDLEDM